VRHPAIKALKINSMDETGVGILASFLCLLALPVGWWLWQYMRIQKTRGWPNTEATIQSADVEVASTYRRGVLRLPVCSFSYRVNGEYYSGRFTVVTNLDENESLVKRMIDRKFVVQYDPRRPSVYFIPDRRIDGCEVKQQMDPRVIRIYPSD
jgi:hypothetical protein